VGALLLGLVVGLIALPRLFSGMDTRAESYVVLASTLFKQGEAPTLLRDRLVSVGIAQPTSAVLSIAQRYAASGDKNRLQQAGALERFGKALLDPATTSPSATPAVTGPAQPTPGTPGPMPAIPSTPIGARPTQPAGAAAAGTPPAGQVGVPLPSTPAPGPPVGGAAGTSGALASPTTGGAPAGTPGLVQRGRVKGGPALLRKEPTTVGGTLSLIPNAAQVEVLEVVRGQDIGGETGWLRARYGNLTGYVSSTLVVVGD
jgi:hypothetical protein